jgi:hypothetical protein
MAVSNGFCFFFKLFKGFQLTHQICVNYFTAFIIFCGCCMLSLINFKFHVIFINAYLTLLLGVIGGGL